ncbi:hypothetical protein [Chitinophaga sp. RAB17]|uniref:hypothetical protein n=1 Tax=Chitinophaga sp. RAB17 TaxID=3233049 RepID=UPI003F93897B
MNFNNPLLVPIDAKAFVVNRKVLSLTGINIKQWQYAYPALKTYSSPEPKAFTGGVIIPQTGIVVHWTLPDIIRNGTQGDDGTMNFPLVPNRWLVVRYSGPLSNRKTTAWVVESDALDNNDPITGGSPFLNPDTNQIEITFVGQVVPLDNYKETSPPPSLFLTAVAPGNNMFASYQPYCWNVFSIFDPLDNVPSTDDISYFVGGWYSDPSADITGSWQQGSSFQAFMDDAGWQLATPTDDVANWSIYQGFVWGIKWDINGPAPTNIPDGSQVKVAIGNTAADALAAMINHQTTDQTYTSLIDAFQQALLPLLDQPNASIEIQQQLKAAAYGYTYGGYGWDIVNAATSGDIAPALDPAEAVKEAEWLAVLNQAQVTYEQALIVLNNLQYDLFQTWWKYNFVITNKLINPYPQGTSKQQFQDALNPNLPSSLISRVYQQLQEVAQLQTAIPFGVTQEELQAAILRYAAGKDLPDTRTLKQYAKRPFAHAYDPVVLLQGIKNDLPLSPTAPLVCRFMSQLVTGISYNGGDITVNMLQSIIPIPADINRVPPQMENLLQECFFLDPLNATMITQAALGTTDPATINAVYQDMLDGKNVLGICPDLSLTTWTQPWQPLVMLWDINWYPINHDNGGLPLWNFDGNEYTWDGEGFDPLSKTEEYQGMIFMTPQASFNFRAQLQRMIDEYPNNTYLPELNDFISQVDGWDFLSQSFVGLTPYMKLRVPTPNVSPSVDKKEYFDHITMQDLVGNNANYVPFPGSPQPPRFGDFGPSGFQPWRAGQFTVQRLSIVDKFGQICDVTTLQSSLKTGPILAPALTPQHAVLPDESYRFGQLSPRLLQPARLNLDFVAADSDAHILGLTPGTNPICAWLLHNFLDQSIACYDAPGNIIGAVSLVYNEQAQRVVHWQPAVGSVYQTITDLINTPALNHLGLMLQNMQQIGADAFTAMLATLDKAAINIDGAHTSTDTSLMLLAGKPVAMVRLRVQFELNAVIDTDPSWRFTFQPDISLVPAWKFNIRLGETVQRTDGLIGYFIGAGYDVFYTDSVPAGTLAGTYIQAIGNGDSLKLSFDDEPAYLSLLMDPRTLVHATTGILPVIDVTIPQEFVTPAFANMDLSFHIGPLLSVLVSPAVPAPDTDNASIVFPAPALKKGTWSWQQLSADEWNTYTITPADGTAQFSNVPLVMREGLLTLKGAVTK